MECRARNSDRRPCFLRAVRFWACRGLVRFGRVQCIMALYSAPVSTRVVVAPHAAFRNPTQQLADGDIFRSFVYHFVVDQILIIPVWVKEY